jgi:hypothetical protein
MNARDRDRHDNSRPFPDNPGGVVVRAAFGRSAGPRVCARCGAESCVAWGSE